MTKSQKYKKKTSEIPKWPELRSLRSVKILNPDYGMVTWHKDIKGGDNAPLLHCLLLSGSFYDGKSWLFVL